MLEKKDIHFNVYMMGRKCARLENTKMSSDTRMLDSNSLCIIHAKALHRPGGYCRFWNESTTQNPIFRKVNVVVMRNKDELEERYSEIWSTAIRI